MLKEYPAASKLYVNETPDVILCIPEESVLVQRDVVLSQLQTGTIPYLDLQDLLKDFPEVYSSTQQLEDHLATVPDVDLHGQTAVSNTWLSTFGDGCLDAIKVLGYADLTVSTNSPFLIFAFGLGKLLSCR